MFFYLGYANDHAYSRKGMFRYRPPAPFPSARSFLKAKLHDDSFTFFRLLHAREPHASRAAYNWYTFHAKE